VVASGNDGPLGIPGTTQTESGYDVEMGADPICWTSLASRTHDEGIPFPNGELVKDFAIADNVQLLKRCPTGIWLETYPPPEFLEPGFRPRTLSWYNYTVKGSIQFEHLQGLQVVSDEGSRIALGIVACDSSRAGFCSPFVHEQANVREAEEKEKFGHTLFAEKRITGDRHGGTHVHAPAVIVDVTSSSTNPTKFDFEAQIPMRINDPGTFFVIGTLQFFMGNAFGHPEYRYDIANALHLDYVEENERLVAYQDPPEILVVTEGVKLASYVVVGIAGAIILFLLAQTIWHYKSQVLQISQAPFLVVFLLAALVATVSSLLFDPQSDLNCQLAFPLVLISLQLLYAVTLGRLWRIHSVISPLLKNRFQRAPSSRRGFGSLRACCPSRPASFRREVNGSKVAIIAVAFTLPQVILQVLAWVLQPASKTVEFNGDESVGRCICNDGVEAKRSIQIYALAFLFVLILILLIMAHIARQLPSLLNESAVIYDTSVTSIVLAILGVGVIAVADDPTMSPDISYMVHVVLTLSMTLNSSVRIIMPKLKMAWSGQTVLVSKLVQDQRQTLFDSTKVEDRDSLMHNVTGLSIPSGASDHIASLRNSGSHRGNSITAGTAGFSEASMEPSNNGSIVGGDFSHGGTDSHAEPSRKLEEDTTDSSGSDKSSSAQDFPMKAGTPPKSDTAEKAKKIRGEHSQVTFHKPDGEQEKKRERKPTLIVEAGKEPNRKLTVKMLDLQVELDTITNRIMSGLQVDPKDWEKARELTENLNETFSLVQFDWEASREMGVHVDEELGGTG